MDPQTVPATGGETVERAPPRENEADTTERVVRGRIAEGSTLFVALRRAGLSPKQVLDLIARSRPHVDLDRKVRAGDRYELVFDAQDVLLSFGFQGRAGAVHLRRIEGRMQVVPGPALRVQRDAGTPALPEVVTPADVLGETGASDASAGEPPDAPMHDILPDLPSGETGVDPSAPAETEALSPAEIRQQQRAARRAQRVKEERADRRTARAAAREKVVQRARRVEGLPRRLDKLIGAWLQSDDEVRRLAIALKLNRKFGAAKTRKALARGLRPRKCKPGSHRRTVMVDGAPARYTIYVPRGYRPGRSMPLHISLHGGGGNGDGTCRLRWVRHEAPRKFLLACPTSPTGTWTGPKGEKIALAVYRDVLAHFAVHADRVSIGGISNGGTGAWHLASKYPWIWAAAVPRAGVRLLNEQWVENLRGIPSWIVHGDADGQIHVSNSRWMVERLKGLSNEVRYTEVAGGGHKFFPAYNPKIVRWILPKKRRLPRRFSYTHTRGKPAPIARWISCQRCGTISARMKSTGAGTEVTVKTEQEPRGLKVWFPKGRADPRRPVRVVLNGDVVYQGRMNVSAMNVLESFAASGDLRRMFSGAVTAF